MLTAHIYAIHCLLLPLPCMCPDVGKAYDTLSNAEKRRVYDQYGEQGLQGMPSHGQNQQEFYGV